MASRDCDITFDAMWSWRSNLLRGCVLMKTSSSQHRCRSILCVSGTVAAMKRTKELWSSSTKAENFTLHTQNWTISSRSVCASDKQARSYVTWSTRGTTFEKQQRRELRKFVQAESAHATTGILVFFRAGPFRMAARTLPMHKSGLHDLHVGESDAYVGRPKDNDKLTMLMPEFQAQGPADCKSYVEGGTKPLYRAAAMYRRIELVELLPRFLEARMSERCRNSQRAFDRRGIGAEALPEHWRQYRHLLIRQQCKRLTQRTFVNAATRTG